MDVYVNMWGGEGYLSAASMLTLACVGFYDDVKDASGSQVMFHFGCYDFVPDGNSDKKRCKDLFAAYNKYYCGILKNVAPVVVDTNVSIINMVQGANPKTLDNKYHASRQFLAFGCNRSDITTDLSQGIYGKPWVGEAYYADSIFHQIYNGANGNIVVINCGGYKGGGTAATFIPLENRHNIQSQNPNVTSAERFNIIVGPSTTFDRRVVYPNKGIYNNAMYDNGVDLFAIPDVIEKLNAMITGVGNEHLHEANVKCLETEYKKVYDPDAHGGPVDRRSLNPINYMPRFVERVESDVTMGQVSANFINLKPNLSSVSNGEFNYDVTCDRFAPDGQAHKLHITNMLSAAEIKEIATNHSSYTGGKVMVFQNPSADTFTLDGVLDQDDVKKAIHFVIFSMLITDYAFNCFNDITNPGIAVMLDKWAITTTKMLKKVVALDPNTPAGALNVQFATAAKNYLIDLAHEYIRPVLESFIQIQDTSPDVSFFSKTPVGQASDFPNGVYGIVRGIVDKIKLNERGERYIEPINDANVIKANAVNSFAALIMNRFGHSDDYNTCMKFINSMQNNIGFLNYYQSQFPEFGKVGGIGNHRKWAADVNSANVETHARKYCESIIKITYKAVCDNFT